MPRYLILRLLSDDGHRKPSWISSYWCSLQLWTIFQLDRTQILNTHKFYIILAKSIIFSLTSCYEYHCKGLIVDKICARLVGTSFGCFITSWRLTSLTADSWLARTSNEKCTQLFELEEDRIIKVVIDCSFKVR